MQGTEYAFGPFRFHDGRGELSRDGHFLEVGSRALQLLGALLKRNGGLVTKEELFQLLWPNTVVEEGNLSTQIWTLRKALSDLERPNRLIASVPGRGYRFIGILERSDESETRLTGSAPARSPSLLAEPELHNLPRQLVDLIGRDVETAAVSALIKERRLVTVAGAGGLGKTQLALHVGTGFIDVFADGVWWVALDRLSHAEQVPEAVAGLFRLPVASGRSAVEVVTTYLRRKTMLLILDNCEHLVSPIAKFVEAVLNADPDVRILTTSREPLRLAGEHVYRLSPLQIPSSAVTLKASETAGYSAIALFVRRASSVTNGFSLTDATAPLVAEICIRLDGIALAIELAAARLNVLTLPDLLHRLDDRLRLLSGGARTATPRQQTLDAAIGWSYELLTDGERSFFRRLAVFGGSFTLVAAGQVASDAMADAIDAINLLNSLVEKSLVVPLADHPGRFRLFESTRAFGLARLNANEMRTCHMKLLDSLILLFHAAEIERSTTGMAFWRDKYGPELENLRTALTWAFGSDGDHNRGAELASRSSELWSDFSLLRERQRWLGLAASKMDERIPKAIRGRLIFAPTNVAFGSRQIPPQVIEAIEIFRDTGDTLYLAMALRVATMAVAREGDVVEAKVFLGEAEGLVRPLGLTRTLLLVLTTKALLRKFAGDFAGARRCHAECLQLSRLLGNPTTIFLSQITLAELDFAEGDVETAILTARDTCTLCRNTGMPLYLAGSLQNLAAYLLVSGDAESGRAAAREALDLNIELDPNSWVAHCLEHLALAAAMTGDLLRAAGLAGYTNNLISSERVSRETTEDAGWRELQRLLHEGLGSRECARLMAEGAAWTADIALMAARGETVVRF